MSQLTGPTDTVLSLDQPAGLSLRSLMSDLSQLTKPRITLVVMFTVWIGYEIGHRMLLQQGVILEVTGPLLLPAWVVMWLTIAGSALSCMGASALNQWIERDTDKHMRRTADRPLPAGRLTPLAALALGVLLSLWGVGMLAAFANGLTAVLGAATVISYAFIYTPMKRVSSVNTIIGAVPGALPPVMGYAAVTGRLDLPAAAMFGIVFLWQLPHFLAIAWMYKDEYAAAGMPMLPVIDIDGRATCRQMMFGCFALLPLGLLPVALQMAGMVYFAGSLLAGVMFLLSGICFVRHRTRRNARAMFLTSLVYLPLVFVLMLLNPA
jgi:protoheme IX farnesyltransferase